MQDTLDTSFVAMVEPLRGALRVHCYRMLGSSHDGDDMVQETLLRAWRARESLKDPELVRPWLYRIATNACLDELKRRPRRARAMDTHPPADPLAPIAPPLEEALWLEPMPDTWLDAASPHADPSSRYALKESVALAFVAALQLLPPGPRAVLLLRDVVGLSAEETAEALGMTLAAANSALFRARAQVEEKLGGKSATFASSGPVDEALLAQYVRAFEESNVEALVALLHDDVKSMMPPHPTWLDGREATRAFFTKMFANIWHAPGALRVIRTGANGQPAFAFYRAPSPGEPRTLRAINVVTFRSDRIAAIDHFLTPAVFPLFPIPQHVA